MQDGKLDLTWKRTVSVWWLMVWRGSLGAFAAIGGAVFLVAIISTVREEITFGEASDDLTDIETLAAFVFGGLLALVWAVVATRMALRKEYGDFRIALLPRVDHRPDPIQGINTQPDADGPW